MSLHCRRRALRLVAPLLATLFVAACATVPPPEPASGRAADPAELTQWLAKGRIALASQGQGGSGSFVWQQRSELTELTVRGPLGAGGLRVVTDGSVLEVDDGSGRTLDGAAARAIVEERLGARLPLEQMRYWLLGVAAPATSGVGVATPVGANGFEQQGWTVVVDERRLAGPWTLPARLTATSAGTRVRIVVDDWQLPPRP